MSPERYALMEEYARLAKNRYCTLRQASSPGWAPRAKDDKHWLWTGLMCINHGFDPSEYVEALFIYAKPYPLVAYLHSEKMAGFYRMSRARRIPERTSVEWEKQATCEIEFIDSRISAYGTEVGLRIALIDDGLQMSPAARALVASFTKDVLGWAEMREAFVILTSELVGPVYVRKFGPVLGRSNVEAFIKELETYYEFGP